ncbi:hypothetical protein NPIL_594701 [Nephila pilipes]|uniref:Uncharacterized protein n=1 Tax=Nephila pilipes TaxID=299642 RepID=A0A8X6R926_NEPPI|nr:hypothetical protein NPIL_594701 [Nephila pilipes]
MDMVLSKGPDFTKASGLSDQCPAEVIKGVSWPRVRGSALSRADAVPRPRKRLWDGEKERHWSHECSEANIAGSLPKEVEGLHDWRAMLCYSPKAPKECRQEVLLLLD